MEEEQKSNLESENLNESSNESKGKFKMPWQNKFGEDENLKNRQYSRTARNQPVREATTLSKVLLFMVVCTCLVPFIVYMWVNATRSNQTVTPKTASQVAISRVESSSAVASSSSAVESSASTQSASATANVASGSENAQSGSTTDNTQQANNGTANNNNNNGAATTRRGRTRTSQAQGQQAQQQAQTPQQGQGGTYTIQAGDSWYSIATRHGVDVYALAAANGATIDSLILPGQTINIP